MRRIPLRRQLFLLAIAGVLPLAILAGAGLLVLYEQQRDLAQRRTLEITRALATAVDAELERSLAALQMVATSDALESSDLPRFHEMARRAVAAQPRWRSIRLTDPSGRHLLSTAHELGRELGPVLEKQSFEDALHNGRPRVGSLATGPGGAGFPLRVPVVKDGAVRYVVTAVMDPGAIVDIVRRQGVPEEWVISVFDAQGARVARSRAHERFIGTPAAEGLRSLMALGGNEGMAVTRALEGDSVFTAYTRLASSGWSVAIGLPTAEVNRQALNSAAVYALATGLSLLVGLLAAFALARRINVPMGELREAADMLGKGGLPNVPETDIREVREAGEAIVAAAQRRLAFEAERETLLRREQGASRAKDEFLAMLAHELRNPLAALSNAASLLDHGGDDPRIAARAQEVIQRQVSHLARLTDDLLDAARALMGKIELRRAPVDLARVAAQSLQTLTVAGRMTNHRVTSDLREAWIEGDAVRLVQIVSNLLVNAVKYTPSGGSVRIATKCENGEAVLTVTDDGAGLAPELAARVFDLFVQGERSIDRSAGGLGIGLTLVRRLAELHGGTADARSDGENLGSEFTLRFPAIGKPLPARERGAASLPQ